MSHPIIKLLHGADQLDLMSAADGGTGRYKVAPNFALPSAQRSVTYSADVRGSRASQKELINSSWTFGVHIKAANNEELQRGKSELQSFLNRGGGSTPLYLAHRSYNDYDFEPFFGLAGCFARYQIEHAWLGPSQRVERSNTFFFVPVNLTIRPQAVYPPQPSGQATGGIFEDHIGRPDGKPRGTVLGSAITNKFTNPAFMNSTWNDGWTASVLLATENKDSEYVLFGDTSAMLQNPTPGAGTLFTQSINVGNTNTHTISFYVKRDDGGVVTEDHVIVWYGGSTGPDAVESVGDGWYRVITAVTGVAAATATGLRLASNSTHFFDGFQIEQRPDVTPFLYGDLLGCTWSGTKNASTSSRAAARLRYEYAKILNRLTNFTIRIVLWPHKSDFAGSAYLLEDSDDDLALWLDSSERYNFRTSAASSIQSSAIVPTPGTSEIIHVTFDGTTANIYRNGVLLVTGTIAENAALPTYLYVGSTDEVGNQINATIQGFGTFTRVMSAADVLADYNAIKEQADDGERIDPLPWVWTPDGDNIVDNDNDGTLNNFCVIGGLMGDDVDTAYKLDSSNSFVLGGGVTWGSLPVDQREMDKDILTTGGTNTLLFVNGSGTVDAGANDNDVTRISLSTSITNTMATATTPAGARLLRRGFSVVGYFVAKDTSTNTNVQVQAQITLGPNQETYYSTRWRTIATSDSFRPFITAEMPLGFGDPILDSQRKIGFRFRFRRQAGATTENFDISHAIWLVNYSSVYTADVGTQSGVDMCYVRDRAWEGVDDANPTLVIGRRIFNRPLHIRPDLLNVLMLQHTSDNFAASKTGWTTGYNLEIEQFVVTPRFDIF